MFIKREVRLFILQQLNSLYVYVTKLTNYHEGHEARIKKLERRQKLLMEHLGVREVWESGAEGKHVLTKKK